MPMTTVAAPAPSAVLPLLTEATSVLAQQVYLLGKCTTSVLGMTDPWFPAENNEIKLAALAPEACAGCPVIAECLEMTLRLEADLSREHITGIFGAKAGHERLALIEARRTAGGETR